MSDKNLNPIDDYIKIQERILRNLQPNLDLIQVAFNAQQPATQLSKQIKQQIVPHQFLSTFQISDVIKQNFYFDSISDSLIKSNLDMIDNINKAIRPYTLFADLITPKIDFSDLDRFNINFQLDVLDFRFNIISQDISNIFNSINKQLINTSQDEIKNLEIEFDKFIPESFVDTQDNDSEVTDINEIKQMVVEIYKERQEIKNNYEDTFKKDKNGNQMSESANKLSNKIISLLLSIILLLDILEIPNRSYELFEWYRDILTRLISIF